MANSILAKMAVQISANAAEFNRKLSETQNKLTSFTSGITKIAGAVGLAFGVQQVASFALEVSKLAGEAKGVDAAFKRLPNSTRLMEELKEATGSTVSELDLMKRAVQASNFDISLKALPDLLEFATLRAQQTGQSVDYLVDSIVTGIGRKSKLILDNLGISAVALDAKLNGVSVAAASVGEVAEAVGKIAKEGLQNMAGFSENAATKLQRLNAEWVNFKVTLGTASNNIGAMGDGIDTLSKLLVNLSAFLESDAASALFKYLELVSVVPRKTLQAANAALEYANAQSALNQKVKEFNERFSDEPFAGVIQDTQEFQQAVKELGQQAEKEGKKVKILRDEFGKTVAVVKPFTNTVTALDDVETDHIETLEALRVKQKELNEQFESATAINDIKKLTNIGNQIKALQEQINKLEELRKIAKEEDPLKNFQFIPDVEAEESLNLELRNEQAINSAEEFTNAMAQVAASADFAGGALVKLENQNAETSNSIASQWIDLGPMISGAITGIASAIGGAIAGTKKFGEAVAEALGGFMQQFGAALIAMGVGKVAFDSFSGPGMIAAGAVLVAAGAAVQAAINNRPDLKSSSRSGGFGGPQVSTANNFNGGAFNERIELGGTIEIAGDKLLLFLRNAESRSGARRG